MGAAFVKSFQLLFTGDHEIYFIAFTSIRIALISTLLSSFVSLPVGIKLAFSRFKGRRAIIVFLNSLMSLPTVVIGLIVYSFISRSGPLGAFGLLFSPGAIVIGQFVLSFPIITSMVYGALSGINQTLPETLVMFRVTGVRRLYFLIREAKTAILLAIVAGFGRVIGEVGVSMMLGGNIRWYTRTITTAIALETSKGDFELGLALGIILLVISLGITSILHAGVRHE